MKTPIELEKEFDTFFSQINFDRVSDIVGASPNFSNADYINKKQKIIVELKVIDKDFFEKGGIIHRLNTIITVPKNIDTKGYGQYEFTLPNQNREGKHDTFEEPLRRILKKANKQIRETNRVILNDNGIGFVMIALNMQTAIDPEKIRELTGELVSREFSSISGFVICTLSYGFNSSETGLIHPVCLPTTEYGCPEWIHKACVDIGTKWCEFGNKVLTLSTFDY